MEPIRLACVRYLNTLPLIEGLAKTAGVELIPTVPSRIAPMLRAGDADVGLASVLDASCRPGSGPALALLPVGMIGCDGPTLTVRLFSSTPFERIGALHADTDSRTSVALARILLERRFGARPRVIPWTATGPERGPRHPGPDGPSRDGEPPSSPTPNFHPESAEPSAPQAMLLIGDKVVTAAPPAERYPHQLDLGEAWKAWTGLPFVYAVWMCRSDEAASPRVRLVAALLDRQRRHNRTRLDWIIAKRAAEHGWPAGEARRYLGSLLTFRVGAPEREAVGRFLHEAASLGLAHESGAAWAWDDEAVALEAP